MRRLAELHPAVKVKVLYQRDYLSLLVKYGLQEPSHIPPAKTPAIPHASKFNSQRKLDLPLVILYLC